MHFNVKQIFPVVIVFLIMSCTFDGSLKNISRKENGVYDQFAWSPDGLKIVSIFSPTDTATSQLDLYNIETGKWMVFGDVTDVLYNVEWVDNETIAYNVSEANMDNLPEINSQLVFFNVSTKERIATEKGPAINDIKKNPQENTLALTRILKPNQASIVLHDLSSHEESILYNPSDGESVSDIAWNPDGTSIAYVLTKDNPPDMSTMYSYSLNIINLESKKVTVLIDNAERTIDEISWPQKAKIVIRKIDSNYKPRAFFVDLDGKMEPIDLREIAPLQVLLSPVGDNRILFSSLGEPGANDLYLLLSTGNQ